MFDIIPNLLSLPFYAYIRLVLLSYLVLPQTQGARLLYQSHIHPFLAHHEADIDTLITHAHDRAKAAGLSSLKRFIDFVKEKVLGLPPKSQPVRASPEGSYAQTLLSRFNLPSARQGLAAPAGDFYGLLSAALGQAGAGGGGTREAPVEEKTGGTLIPHGMTSASEKMTFLATQRERLRLLLTALDKEASGLETEESIRRDVERRLATPASDDDGLRKSRSEAEFDTIEREDWTGDKDSRGGGAGGDGGSPLQSWMPWGRWGSSPPSAKGKEAERGSSSGVDVG
ncbi:hypothetical protein MMC07_006252 [Pseudocyphellaria aurata]|nr:hypothetical protein [Pseudocyphellaria aurata]